MRYLPKYLWFGCFITLWLGMSIVNCPISISLWSIALLIIASLHPKASVYGWCIIMLIAFLFVGSMVSQLSPHPILANAWSDQIQLFKGKEVVVRGVVSQNIRSPLSKYGSQSADIDRIRFVINGKENPFKGKIHFVHVSKKTPLEYGQAIEARIVLKEPMGLRNPAGFNYKDYLYRNKIFAVGEVRGMNVLGLDKSLLGNWLRWRFKVIQGLKRHLSKDAYPIASAMFMGERKSLDYSFRNALAHTGTLHLFAISGLHIGIVIAALLWVCSKIGLSSTWSRLITSSAILFYACLAGANPSALRASIMGCVLMWILTVKRRPTSLNAVGLAGILILLINPEDVGNPGFTLSFVATIGLILIVPSLYSIIDVRNMRSDSRFRHIWAFVEGSIIVSFSASIVTIPWTIHYFHYFNWISPFLNIFLIPLVMFLVASLVFFVFIISLLPSITFLFSPIIEALVQSLTSSVLFFEQFQSFVWPMKSFPIIIWSFYLIGVIWLIRSKGKSSRYFRLSMMILILSNCLILNSALAYVKPQTFKVTFFDVGQGDCALIEFKKGGRMLVDTGKPGFAGGFNAVDTYLRSNGQHRIDTIVISHPQYDHAGALKDFVKHYEIDSIISNGDVNDVKFFREAKKSIHLNKIKELVVGAGNTILGFDGADIEVLHPHLTSSGGLKLNDNSVVIKVTQNELSYLFTGDLESEGMRRLYLSDQNLKSDIVKFPHHGAKLNINGVRLLNKTKAKKWIIPVGANNKYGHPAQQSIDYLNQTNKPYYRTDRDGAIRIESTSSKEKPIVRIYGN